MRLIDADALIPMMKYATTDSDIGVFPIKIGFDAIVKVINAQPTIEPRKGKWTGKGDSEGFGIFVCGTCGKFAMMKSNFCPNCGADMRGAEDD